MSLTAVGAASFCSLGNGFPAARVDRGSFSASPGLNRSELFQFSVSDKIRRSVTKSHRVRSGRPAFRCSSINENQVEILYDPQGRYNELISDLQSSGNKINVFLRIMGKRPDGYHDLASLFHVISLGDIIKFSVSPSTRKDSLTTNVRGVPLDDTNLIIKALNLYRKKTQTSTYFWIHLDKRVPTGAGLGGGSGNAATALWAANQLNGCLVSEKELQEWSGEIGSDIPFFFSNGAAYCSSRGEVVENISPPIPLSTPLVLMKPEEECGTADVYKALRLEECSSADPQELYKKIVQNGITQEVCINDLEKPAFQVLPSLKQFKDRIVAASRGRFQSIFMSGSGSTIVGVGDIQPPEFLYDEDKYSNVFVSEAYFMTRKENEWYDQPNMSVPES